MLGIIMILAAAVFFNRAAEMENLNGWCWALISIAASFTVPVVLGLGPFIGFLTAQILVFAAMGARIAYLRHRYG